MQNDNVESIIQKAKEYEKKYEWLQATEYYQKAKDLVLNEKDVLRATKYQERLGYCFYRAAFQVESNIEFKKHLTYSNEAYKKELQMLKDSTQENKQIRITQIQGLIAFIQSRYETNPSKKKELLDKWWTLEHNALEYYEKTGDFHSAAKIHNDLIEFWQYDYIWLIRNHSEMQKKAEELRNLAEKAIEILSKLDDNYELARAYCLASWGFGWGEWATTSPDQIVHYNKKCNIYSKQAMKLAKKT
ncbi:MAG: hypothetical protein P8Y18_06275 [Candidatus Bathyarchaeota archaeon]